MSQDLEILSRELVSAKGRLKGQLNLLSDTEHVLSISKPNSAIRASAAERYKRHLAAVEASKRVIAELEDAIASLSIATPQSDIESVAPPKPLKGKHS